MLICTVRILSLLQVIQRIFYVVNRSWTGRITMMELRRSNFLQTLALLEEEDDINQITDYFSYEHFYVIYCKFWELDTDHDLYIDAKDLARYNDHGKDNLKGGGFHFPNWNTSVPDTWVNTRYQYYLKLRNSTFMVRDMNHLRT